MYYKIDIAGKNGYSFMIMSNNDESMRLESDIIEQCAEKGLFHEPEDAKYATVDDLVSDEDIKHFIECGAIFNLQIDEQKPPKLTCIEGLCLMVGCDIKHELTASLKVEGMLNYLQEQGVIETYNADRLDYIFGNDEPY